MLFAPEDLLVLKGAPAERRRILDLDLGQAAPTYRVAHARYAQVLRQRNALLRTHEHPPRALLDTWNAAWAQAALALTAIRARLVLEAAPQPLCPQRGDCRRASGGPRLRAVPGGGGARRRRSHSLRCARTRSFAG
ncbi:hypothetical protein B1A_06687, partial [mine drainage metagenome]